MNNIVFERGIFTKNKNLNKHLPPNISKVAIIAHKGLPHGPDLKKSLKSLGIDTLLVTIPQGEEYKTRETKTKIEDTLLSKNFGSEGTIIAIGGGTVTDITGFVASTYCRGVPLILIPTTLLGMVDGSLGGKNGVNTPFGKNMIGTIYQPSKVIIDPCLLHTLPKKEMKNGFVEMLKHGIIANKKYFNFLAYNMEDILEQNPQTLDHAIVESIKIKMKIVNGSLKVKNLRHILNFGHTVGHAVELLSNFSVSHGEAVAFGMIAESLLSKKKKMLSNEDAIEIINCIKKLDNIHTIQKYSNKDFIKAMRSDKKSYHGEPGFVLPDGIGKMDSKGNDYIHYFSENKLIYESIADAYHALFCN